MADKDIQVCCNVHSDVMALGCCVVIRGEPARHLGIAMARPVHVATQQRGHIDVAGDRWHDLRQPIELRQSRA